MGMMDRARAAMRAWRSPDSVVAGAPSAAADGLNDVDGLTYLSILGGGSRGAPPGEQAALSVPAVLRALEVLCGLFAITPVHYYRRNGDGKDRVDEAPQALMLRTSTNEVQNAYLFKELMLGDLVMTGRFGSYIHRDALYRPHRLTRLDPRGIAPLQSWNKQDGLECFYDACLPDGSQERLTRNDIWYVPGFSRDGVTGLDRLKLLAETIEAAAATSTFARRFWENNAQPSTILTTKAKVEGPAKEQIKRDWQARFGGPRNAGGVAVLDQEMDAKFLAHDNKASQFIETRSFYVVEIARAFGVPPHVVYELSRATFSNIEQQSLDLILHSMMSHYSRVAAAATHQFAEPGHFFEFMPEALLKGDIKSRYEAYAIAVDKGILNPNEVRHRENMNDREGGDEYRVGSGATLEGHQAPTQSPPAPPAPPAPDPAEEDE